MHVGWCNCVCFVRLLLLVPSYSRKTTCSNWLTYSNEKERYKVPSSCHQQSPVYLRVSPEGPVTMRSIKGSNEPCQLLGATHDPLARVYAAAPLLGPLTKMKDVSGRA